MKTLYIHGLDSFPVPEKIDILKKQGLNTVALHIDYRNNKDVFEILLQFAIEHKIELVVGSSLGGYLAFWIGAKLKVPQILYNPAIHYEKNFGWEIPEISIPTNIFRCIILGDKDGIVNPELNYSYFNKQLKSDYTKMIRCSWLGHKIDLCTFEETIQLGITAYKNSKK